MNIENLSYILDRAIFILFLAAGVVVLIKTPWRSLWAFSSSLSPAVIDGTLYTSWTMLTALLGVMSSEEAYKYVDPWVLFYSKAIMTCIVAGVGALKAFRSSTYADSKKGK